MIGEGVFDAPSADDRRMWDLWLSGLHQPAIVAADEAGIFTALAESPIFDIDMVPSVTSPWGSWGLYHSRRSAAQRHHRSAGRCGELPSRSPVSPICSAYNPEPG